MFKLTLAEFIICLACLLDKSSILDTSSLWSDAAIDASVVYPALCN